MQQHWEYSRESVRKTFGPVWVGDDFRIRSSDLYELPIVRDVVQRIHTQWLRWLTHYLVWLTGVGAQKAEALGGCVKADWYPLSGLLMAKYVVFY